MRWKPFDDVRFLAAFDRARRRIDERRSAEWAQRLVAATPDRGGSAAAPQLPRLAVPVRDRVVFVDFDDIDWIQAADQYVIVHAGAKQYLLRESLRRLARRLPPEQFARIHRSHVVNLSRIPEVKRLANGDARVTLAHGLALRLSRRYRADLRPVLAW